MVSVSLLDAGRLAVFVDADQTYPFVDREQVTVGEQPHPSPVSSQRGGWWTVREGSLQWHSPPMQYLAVECRQISFSRVRWVV